MLRDAFEVPCAIRSCSICVVHIMCYLGWHNATVHEAWVDTSCLEACAAPLSLDLVLSQMGQALSSAFGVNLDRCLQSFRPHGGHWKLFR